MTPIATRRQIFADGQSTSFSAGSDLIRNLKKWSRERIQSHFAGIGLSAAQAAIETDRVCARRERGQHDEFADAAATHGDVDTGRMLAKLIKKASDDDEYLALITHFSTTTGMEHDPAEKRAKMLVELYRSIFRHL